MGNGCKLFFVGDIVLTKSASILEAFSPEVCEIIKQHDFSCCNFEAPIESDNMVAERKVGPALFQRKEAPIIIEEAGFNIIDIANNHMLDYGIKGLKDTMDAFKKAKVIGASDNPGDVYRPYIEIVNGIRVGFLMVAENGFGCADEFSQVGYAWMNDARVDKLICDMRKLVDVLVINCHAGAERWEYPLPEIRELYKKWIDKGVDIVIGHHPHVVQGWEKYKNGFIAYSLGNFNFEAGVGETYNNTIGVSIEIDDNLNISHEIIYFTKTQQCLMLGAPSEFIEYYQKITVGLNQQEYEARIDEKIEEVYEKIYKDYYYRVMGLYRGGVKAWLKSFIRRVVMREKFSEIWLFHNTVIETHYWITRRVLCKKIKKEREKNE